MSKKEYTTYKKTYFLLPFSIVLILIVGVIISVIQLRQQQTTQSQADVSIQNCTVAGEGMAITTEEQILFDNINQLREQHGLQPLVWSEPLARAAAWMSEDMLTTGNLDHTDSLGRNIATRINQCGNPATATVGETVDSGTADAAQLFAAWQHAPSQTANILNPIYTQAGVALSTNDDESQAYWTLTLSSPEPTPSPTTAPTLTPIPTTTVPTPTTKPGQATKTPTPSTVTKAPSPTPIKSEPTKNLTPSPTRIPTKPFAPSATPLPTNTPIPTPHPDFVQNPLDTQVFASIELPGVGGAGNRTPKNLSRQVQVDLYDTENELVSSGYGFLRYDNDKYFSGIIHFGDIPDGIYYAKILHPYTLSAVVLPQFQTISDQQLNILPNVLLTVGDLDEDNAITIADYNLALQCFQDKACEGDIREQIDFNDDGATDVTDYNILLQNYWRTYGD